MGPMTMEEQLEMEARRRRRSKWRTGVWLVLVGCVALLSFILSAGLFPASDPILRFEAFAGFFVLGCVFLIVSRHSARKKRDVDL
jgi:zinc transporter ZupT